jgi:thiamine biosynthesis lipoprotein
MIGDRLTRESFTALGTSCSVAVTVSRRDADRAREALAAGRAELATCENVLSRFRPDSDLSRLNRLAGSWMRVDERLARALAAAVRLRDETNGRFDPTILPALVDAGYDVSFEQLRPHAPFAHPVRGAAAEIEIDLAGGRARVQADAAVDLGGIGKGFTAERTLWAMREEWPGLPGALVDLGGDVVVWGTPPDDGPWRIAIADPRDHDSTLELLAIERGAIATSGRETRRFGPGGALHHLIDPDTGAPAVAGPLAVTVVGSDATDAEAYATAVAVSDVGQAPTILAARSSLSALVVPANGDPIAIGRLPLSTERVRTEVFT